MSTFDQPEIYTAQSQRHECALISPAFMHSKMQSLRRRVLGYAAWPDLLATCPHP